MIQTGSTNACAGSANFKSSSAMTDFWKKHSPFLCRSVACFYSIRQNLGSYLDILRVFAAFNPFTVCPKNIRQSHQGLQCLPRINLHITILTLPLKFVQNISCLLVFSHSTWKYVVFGNKQNHIQFTGIFIFSWKNLNAHVIFRFLIIENVRSQKTQSLHA